jgi:hypothetical protein
MNSWRGRALFKAGKEVIITYVLQAIPSYVMSMLILPSSLTDDIEKMLNVFWWGGESNNGKGIHLIAWDKLACPKVKGGLGFRNFEAFNMAMVVKQAWNIIQNSDSVMVKLIKARYFPRSSLLEASLSYNPSFAWHSIWKARQVLLRGLGGRLVVVIRFVLCMIRCCEESVIGGCPHLKRKVCILYLSKPCYLKIIKCGI